MFCPGNSVTDTGRRGLLSSFEGNMRLRLSGDNSSPPACGGGGPARKGWGFESRLETVALRAFTWSTKTFDFWANSVPKSAGGAPVKLLPSSTRGRRALIVEVRGDRCPSCMGNMCTGITQQLHSYLGGVNHFPLVQPLTSVITFQDGGERSQGIQDQGLHLH